MNYKPTERTLRNILEAHMGTNLKPVGSNQTEVERKGGVTILYSYSTPVAAFVPGRGALCTTEKYSNTTSRHISAAVARWGATRINVAQSEIDKLAA